MKFYQFYRSNLKMKINNEKFLDYLDEAVENGELTEHEARLEYMLYGDEDNE